MILAVMVALLTFIGVVVAIEVAADDISTQECPPCQCQAEVTS